MRIAAWLRGLMKGSMFSRGLRSLDAYRKAPRDLTEASVVGSVVSLCLFVLLSALVLSQLRAALAIKTTTEIVVDHSDGGQLQVNFKVTMPELSCEWLTVEAVDVIGNRLKDIANDRVYKKPLDLGTIRAPIEHASMNIGDTAPIVYGDSDVDHYGNKKIALELTGKTFDQTVKQHEVMLVDFHAPWCSHCRQLAPIWEHAAELLKEKGHGYSTGAGRRTYSWTIGMATVDCTVEDNMELCKQQHIQAFPTVRVFRKGTDLTDGQGRHHESYHGNRVAESIRDFAIQVLAEVQSQTSDEVLSKPAKSLPREGAPGSFGHAAPGTDGDADGYADSRLITKGCEVEGTLKVASVPGSIIIAPRSEGHTLNTLTLNMTHTVEHLSFGQYAKGRPSYAPPAVRKVWNRVPEDMGGKYATAANPKVMQLSRISGTSHNYFLNVVRSTYVPLESNLDERKVSLFEYQTNVNSMSQAAPAPFEAEPDYDFHIPVIRFQYALSSMALVYKEERGESLFQTVLGLCAIIGGVYTLGALIETSLNRGIEVVKKNMGKIA